MAKWSIPPDDVAAILIDTLHKTVQVAYVDFIDRLIIATPKLTGQLKNNWITSLNGGSGETRPGGSEAGEDSWSQANQVLATYKLGDTISLRNNMPYANRIEYDGWSHTKAPQGMLRITAAQWPTIVTAAIARVKSGDTSGSFAGGDSSGPIVRTRTHTPRPRK